MVGPWNSSNVEMFSFNFTTGKSKDKVSSTIVFKISSGISGETNCLIASNAISECDKLSILSKKDLGKGVMVSGKYKPLSGAIPFITAFLNVVFGAFWFNE